MIPEKTRHVPILVSEILDVFAPTLRQLGGTFVDGTLGGAGHAQALLARFLNIRLIACDQDQLALDRARNRLAHFVAEGRVHFHHGNFSQLSEMTFPEPFSSPWSGLLLDLGYSSDQLEDPNYGMSFQQDKDGPLDMRLSRPAHGPSAWNVLQDASAEDLGEIFATYGEFPGAHRMARTIKQALESGQLSDSTRSLSQLAERFAGHQRNREGIHPATLLFQALRIAVNDELRILDHFLNHVMLKVKMGGRAAFLTFHSLEDRIVKQWGKREESSWRAVHRRPVQASNLEIQQNPRARSAKLRVYERIS